MNDVNPLVELREKYPGAVTKSDDWLRTAINAATSEHNLDYVNQWTTEPEPTMKLPKIPYLFYYDEKYHWIMKDAQGQDRVVDPGLWAKILDREELIDGLYFLGTTAVDQFYGEMELCLELCWRDSRVAEVRLCAPDGDIIKPDLKQFHVAFDQPL